MTFQTNDTIRYFTFDSLSERGLIHAAFTRHGGVSPEPWASLNVGGTVGDQAERVRENRRISFAALSREPASLFDVWQVHGVDVAAADSPRPAHAPYQQADIILTDNPAVTLFMRFADCASIFLFDPVRKAIGLAHAGWLGTVRGAARAAVKAMQSRYRSRPENIMAAIGPAIGPDHYEVGPDVVIQVRQAFGEDAAGLLHIPNGRMHFDLWEANRLLLEQAGVREIEIAGICTACHVDDWYSHRAEKGRTGRFGAMIGLKG